MKTIALLLALCCAGTALADMPARWWPDSVEAALAQSGGNRAELTTALTTVPEARRDGMKFLIENMPPTDLHSLKAAYLLQNTALAYDALAAAPWAKQVPPAIFLNDVLPYASLNESRDNWRPCLHDIAAPLVKDCKTPGEAAHTLNRELFSKVKVRYSTARNRPDQSALETMASGLATCSGLAILLVDACRSFTKRVEADGTKSAKGLSLDRSVRRPMARSRSITSRHSRHSSRSYSSGAT